MSTVLISTHQRQSVTLFSADCMMSTSYTCLILSQIQSCLDENAADDRTDSFVARFVEASRSDTNGDNFDSEDLKHTVRDLIVAGTDTTSSTLRWSLLEMANQPAVQSRLQQEIDTTVGRDRLPSLDDKRSMPYAQAVILETLRRRTILPYGLLHSTLRDTSIGDFFIPAKATVKLTIVYCLDNIEIYKWGE